MVICEQSGSLKNSDDALHVACQCEAVMGQNQQLCGWLGGILVRWGCEPGHPLSSSVPCRRVKGPATDWPVWRRCSHQSS